METIGLQQSVEWMMSRLGKVTASRFKDVLGTKAKRGGYLWEVVTERVTGNPTERFVSNAMLDGTEREPIARMRYEAASGAIVDEAGFLQHGDMDFAGCSPDGLVGDDGGIEIKCPTPRTHLQTILDGMDEEHMPQVQGLLWVTGRKWCDFISYHPEMPERLQLYIQRIERDDDYIGKLAEAVAAFHAEAEAIVARLTPPAQESASQESADDGFISPDQEIDLEAMCEEFGVAVAALKKAAKVERLSQIRVADFQRAVNWIRKHQEAKE